MAAYVIGQLDIFDEVRYKSYLAGFMPIFQRYGGELLATTSGETTVVEGEWGFPRTVVMKFPSRSKAEEWLADPDYRELAEHRYKSAKCNLALIDGVGWRRLISNGVFGARSRHFFGFDRGGMVGDHWRPTGFPCRMPHGKTPRATGGFRNLPLDLCPPMRHI